MVFMLQVMISAVLGVQLPLAGILITFNLIFRVLKHTMCDLYMADIL